MFGGLLGLAGAGCAWKFNTMRVETEIAGSKPVLVRGVVADLAPSLQAVQRFFKIPVIIGGSKAVAKYLRDETIHCGDTDVYLPFIPNFTERLHSRDLDALLTSLRDTLGLRYDEGTYETGVFARLCHGDELIPEELAEVEDKVERGIYAMGYTIRGAFTYNDPITMEKVQLIFTDNQDVGISDTVPRESVDSWYSRVSDIPVYYCYYGKDSPANFFHVRTVREEQELKGRKLSQMKLDYRKEKYRHKGFDVA